MSRARATLAALAVLALPACSSLPSQGTDFRSAIESGTPYRDATRRLYKALLTESCTHKPELRRALVLAPEIAAVRAYEGQATAAAASQLAIARSDVEASDLGCWSDSDPAFAQRHVQMARDEVVARLKELPQLGAGIAALPATADAAKAAGFRAMVRDFADAIEPLCAPIADRDAALSGARTEFAQLRQRLAPTAYAVHFALAEADAKYVRDRTQVECAEPGPAGKTVTDTATRDARQRAAQIAAAAGV